MIGYKGFGDEVLKSKVFLPVGSMCNCLWADDPSWQPTPSSSHFASLGKLEEHHTPWAPYRESFFGVGYWKIYLRQSSVNKILSQSPAVSFAFFLLARAFLCFSPNKGIFFRLKALQKSSYPSNVSPQCYIQNLDIFLLKIHGNLPCWTVLSGFAFLIDFRAQLIKTGGRPLLGLSSKRSLFDF